MNGTVRVGPLTEEEMIHMAMVGHPNKIPWPAYLAVLPPSRRLGVRYDSRAIGQFCDWYCDNEAELEGKANKEKLDDSRNEV